MPRSILLVCLLALLVSHAAAQAPHIDHLAIDDPTGRLTIFGSFGSTPGTVTIDSVLTPWSLWSVDSVVCTIPDNGRGSCGPVRVGAAGYSSNERLLSAWYLYDKFHHGTHAPDNGDYNVESHLQFRIDLVKTLSKSTPSSIELLSTSSSMIHDYGASHPSVGSGLIPNSYDSTIHTPRELHLHLTGNANRIGNFVELSPHLAWGYPITPVIPLDTAFQPIAGEAGMAVPGGLGGELYGPDEPAAFIPPDSLISQVAVVPQYSESKRKGLVIVSGTLTSFRITIGASQGPRTIIVADALGRVVASYSIPAGVSEYESSMDLPSGVYFVEMEGEARKSVILR